MSKLISSDVATAGVWRALIVKSVAQGTYSVYIPALHKAEMPFKNIENPMEGLLETDEQGKFTSGNLHMSLNDYPIANSCVWQARTLLQTGECVWVMFENGDVNYPVILGQVGSNIALTWDVASLMAGSGSGSSSNIEYTGDNASYVFQRLIEAKFPNSAACGILANMEAESGIRPDNLQNSYETSLGYTDQSYTEAVDSGEYSLEQFKTDSAGYGLIQWTDGGRKELLYKNTKGKGSSIADISGQMDTVLIELDNWGLTNKLKAVPETVEGAKQAAYIFCTEFEIPANKEERAKERESAATRYWEAYQNGSLGGATSSETAALTGPLADKIITYIDRAIGNPAKDTIKSNSGTQCVDLVADYLVAVFGIADNSIGNGKDVAYNVASRYPKQFQLISVDSRTQLHKGDIVSYTGNGRFNDTYGHTGIAISGNSSTQTIIDQWNGSGKVFLDTYSDGDLGAIARPRI